MGPHEATRKGIQGFPRVFRIHERHQFTVDRFARFAVEPLLRDCGGWGLRIRDAHHFGADGFCLAGTQTGAVPESRRDTEYGRTSHAPVRENHRRALCFGLLPYIGPVYMVTHSLHLDIRVSMAHGR